MNKLSDLIESLYQQSHEAEQTVSAARTAPLASRKEIQTERLQRVLSEMAEELTTEEQPSLDETPPTDEICLRILNHWDSMTQSLQGIQEHMASLETDILKMQPWGDFDVTKLDTLARRGIRLRFWTVSVGQMLEPDAEPLADRASLHLVSQDTDHAYYVSVTPRGAEPRWPDTLHEVEICPCPISTLIMLQTRDKDALRRLRTLRGDYALAHYSEIYSALKAALPEGATMPPFKKEPRGLKGRLQQLFKR